MMKAFSLYCLVAYSLPKNKLFANESVSNATLDHRSSSAS